MENNWANPLQLTPISFDEVLSELLGTGLIINSNGKLELVSSKGQVIHDGTGIYFGDNRDGKMTSWSFKSLKKKL